MGRSRCKNCGNEDVGTDLVRCRNCLKIYCYDCLMFTGPSCGNCGELWFPGLSGLPFMSGENMLSIGKIGDDDGDDDDDDDDDED